MPPPPEADAQYLRYAIVILSALAAEDGARERAADRIGIPVRTLSRHIEQLGLAALCASEGESAIWSRSARSGRRKPQPG
jgi:hypothetical protein